MTDNPSSTTGDDVIPVEQLSTSYRFDDELASFLTEFQYKDDGITLTADEPRPLSPQVYDASTDGVETVFNSGGSLALICYDGRGHKMVNPIETAIIGALADALDSADTATPRPDGGLAEPLGEEPAPTAQKPGSNPGAATSPQSNQTKHDMSNAVTKGVVTPHNAQRAALATTLPAEVKPNTVEKYQGGERDIIAVSATVDDTEFARQEERFILNPRRLNVAISRSRLLTIVVCSTALFEVTPINPERLADGPIWARLFTQAVGRDTDPAWAGPLAEFTPSPPPEYSDVQIRVYPNSP